MLHRPSTARAAAALFVIVNGLELQAQGKGKQGPAWAA